MHSDHLIKQNCRVSGAASRASNITYRTTNRLVHVTRFPKFKDSVNISTTPCQVRSPFALVDDLLPFDTKATKTERRLHGFNCTNTSRNLWNVTNKRTSLIVAYIVTICGKRVGFVSAVLLSRFFLPCGQHCRKTGCISAVQGVGWGGTPYPFQFA